MAEKTPSSPPELSPRAARLQQITRRVRHLGYVVFFGTAVFVFLPITIGAISGLRQDRIWDPFTGQQITAGTTELDCRDDATALLMDAGRAGKLTGGWEQRHRRWVTRCKGEEPVAYSMLRTARRELRRAMPSSADPVD